MIIQPTIEQVRRVRCPGFDSKTYDRHSLGIGMGLGLGFSGLGAAGGPGSGPASALVSSVPVLQYVEAGLGVTTSTGLVTAWTDQSVNGHSFAATSTARPTFNGSDATLNNLPTITGDGSANALTNFTIPLASGQWFWGVIKNQTAFANGKVLWGGSTAVETHDIGTFGGVPNVTPQLAQYQGTIVNSNGGLPLGSWGRIESYYHASAAYLKLRSTVVNSGTSTGALTATGCQIFATANGNFGPFSIYCRMITTGKPSAGEISALDAWVTARCGAGLV